MKGVIEKELCRFNEVIKVYKLYSGYKNYIQIT